MTLQAVDGQITQLEGFVMGACFSETSTEESIHDESSDEGGYGSLGERPAEVPRRLSLLLPPTTPDYKDEFTNTEETRPRSNTIETDCTDVCHPLQPEHHAAAASHLVGASSLEAGGIVLSLESEEENEDHDDDSVEGMAMQGMFGDPEEGLMEDAAVIKYDKYERAVRGEQAETLTLALVQKHHSLWGEFIYNAARVLADLFDEGTLDMREKSVVELGAGAGLPAIVAALNGASSVAITDYGRDNDRGLVEAIDINVKNLKEEHPMLPCFRGGSEARGYPYVWGDSVESILQGNGGSKYDVVIMADCIFNRSVHVQLMQSMVMLLKPGGACYCSFSHHDPQKTQLDLVFLTLCEEAGYDVEHIHKEQRKSYPFCEKDGLDEKRGWVYVVKISQQGAMGM